MVVTPSVPVKANSGVRARVPAAGKVLEGDDKPLLLQPYLNEKSQSVVARMDPILCKDYTAVHNVTLKEHRLSPCTNLDLFNTLRQSVGETAVMYCACLKSLLKIYVESHKV